MNVPELHGIASKRDAGLVRVIGPWSLAASIVNIIVGAGIFVLPAVLASSMGPYAPLAFIVCAMAVGSVAICFAEGGSRMPTSGGAYGYIKAAFGPLTGYVAGTLLLLGNVLASGGVSAALADVAVSILPQRFKVPAHAVVVLCVIGFIALINIRGAASGARLVSVATALKLIPFAIFIVFGAAAIHWSNFVPVVLPGSRSIGRGMILALFAFGGMEVPLSASGEVKQPERNIPRAMALALLFVTLLYFVVQVIAQGILGASLGHSKVPLADAMARISPALRLLMLAGAGLSMFGLLSSDILGSPRILFAFARDGFLPPALGRVQARSRAPHIAILCYAGLAGILGATGTFAELAVLASLATAVLYIAVCSAAWRLAYCGVSLAGEPLNSRWLPAAAVTGVASMLLLITFASRAEVIGLVVVVAVSVLLYYLTRFRYHRPTE